jgi:hypothetical protein
MVLLLSMIPAVMLSSDALGFWHPHLSMLRWTVSGCAALLFVSARRDSLLLTALLIAIVFLFNPLFPVRLPHATFTNLEIAVSVCFVAAGLLLF